MSDVHTLEARLSALERQNRLFKKVGAAAVLVALAAFVMGQATPKKELTGKRVVEAQGFRLVDKDGKTRGEWSVSPYDDLGLILSDKNGKSCSEWAVLADGSTGLSLFDKNERRRSFWFVDADDGSTRLVLSDKNGKAIFQAP